MPVGWRNLPVTYNQEEITDVQEKQEKESPEDGDRKDHPTTEATEGSGTKGTLRERRYSTDVSSAACSPFLAQRQAEVQRF